MKVSILTFEKWHGRAPGSIGSSMIRGKWLAEAWDDAQLWSNGQYFDAIILQKVYSQLFIEDIKEPKILDLCDPDWFDAENSKCYIKQLGSMVDAITCSTQELTDFVKTFVDIPVITVPDRLNPKYFTRKREHREKAKTVVWFGYYHNAKVVLPKVLTSLKARGLKLCIVSNSPFEPAADYGVEIQNIAWSPQNAFLDLQHGDFAINPADTTSNFRFKSNNKTLISWGLGLPVADTAEEMDRFIDPAERQKEIDLRTKEINEKWDIKYSINQYKEIICQK